MLQTASHIGFATLPPDTRPSEALSSAAEPRQATSEPRHAVAVSGHPAAPQDCLAVVSPFHIAHSQWASAAAVPSRSLALGLIRSAADIPRVQPLRGRADALSPRCVCRPHDG